MGNITIQIGFDNLSIMITINIVFGAKNFLASTTLEANGTYKSSRSQMKG